MPFLTAIVFVALHCKYFHNKELVYNSDDYLVQQDLAQRVWCLGLGRTWNHQVPRSDCECEI